LFWSFVYFVFEVLNIGVTLVLLKCF